MLSLVAKQEMHSIAPHATTASAAVLEAVRASAISYYIIGAIDTLTTRHSWPRDIDSASADT